MHNTPTFLLLENTIFKGEEKKNSAPGLAKSRPEGAASEESENVVSHKILVITLACEAYDTVILLRRNIEYLDDISCHKDMDRTEDSLSRAVLRFVCFNNTLEPYILGLIICFDGDDITRYDVFTLLEVQVPECVIKNIPVAFFVKYHK